MPRRGARQADGAYSDEGWPECQAGGFARHCPVFDKVNGKKVEKTHAPEPSSRCVTEPADWADGEEIMEITYYMPPLTEEETIAYGSLKYYGYTAKLYYKGEPMDCHASPPVLFYWNR